MYSPNPPVSSGWRLAAIARGEAIASVDMEMKQRRDNEQHVHGFAVFEFMLKNLPLVPIPDAIRGFRLQQPMHSIYQKGEVIGIQPP